jgi:uncharacterized protein (DUF362 family)
MAAPLTRRSFLQLGATASLGVFASAPPAAGAGFRVGIGSDPDAYAATSRAIAASGDWPSLAIAGRRVIIKPNLVSPLPSTTGLTTDPQVVRAVVDQALGAGAAQVLIVESGPRGASFSACGYDFFGTYDPLGRVQLVDLSTQATTLAPVPGGGLAYSAIRVPAPVLDPSAVFVSVGKMKTHNETLATLSTKNLFGLPDVHSYVSQPPAGRFAMHDRGINEAIVDVNQLRPIHFSVIDAMWGMEGAGPLYGTPIQVNAVLAGLNAVAVDRAALTVMQIPQQAVRHLAYAARFGLGPADASNIIVAGDALPPQPFALPIISPVVEYPRLVPSAFRPAAGQRTAIALWYAETCMRRLEIVRLYDDSTEVDLIRTIADYAQVTSGYEWSAWDGTDDSGGIVPAGRYAVHVRCYSLRADVRHSDAVTSVTVNA